MKATPHESEITVDELLGNEPHDDTPLPRERRVTTRVGRPIVKPICKACSKQFNGHGRARYCSAICSFWEGVRMEDIEGKGCWPWQKRIETSGYGRFRYQGVDYPAHKMSYAICNDIEVVPMLYNACGDYTCVRPDHLSTEPTDLFNRTRGGWK